MQTTLNAQAIKIMKTFSLRSHASSSCHDVADAILHGKQGKVDTKHVISSQHGWPRSPRYVCIFASETTTFRKPKVARKGLVRHPFTLFPVIALMAFLSPLISPRARNIICLFSPSLPSALGGVKKHTKIELNAFLQRTMQAEPSCMTGPSFLR